MKVLLATENPGKVHEIRGIFHQKLPQTELFCIADLPQDIREKYEAHETGLTYAENSLIKARALAKLADGIIISEDSGFEVEALGRAPGIYSARYAPTDKERCEKILAAIQGVPASQRRAQFVACVTLMENGKNPLYFFGRRTGTVAAELRGEKGFGYDPIFIPDGETQTWGEAPEKSKILVSHRGLAMGLAIEYLIVRLSQNGERAGRSS
ncbi:MAG TPA: RdgB/HAM1 family non-canonical purine NTP pyrophosphatase [Turneriella sp.]|nr:RdgB/HAM1 family non-canonical purine NTP pyrophosphatase [Turneriella sp.]